MPRLGRGNGHLEPLKFCFGCFDFRRPGSFGSYRYYSLSAFGIVVIFVRLLMAIILAFLCPADVGGEALLNGGGRMVKGMMHIGH